MSHSLQSAVHVTSLPHDEGDTLMGQVQSTLATLADIETRFEVERERLETWDGPSAVKSRFAEQLEAQHRQERDRVVKRLEKLQRRIGSQTSSSRLH